MATRTGVKPLIRKAKGVVGGDACIRGTRIAVWMLVEARSMACDEAELLVSYPDLTDADLRAAWAYAEQHADEIAAAIRENEAA